MGPWHEASPGPYQLEAHARMENGGQAVQELDGHQRSHQDEPDPQKGKDLLVQYVEWQQAQIIVFAIGAAVADLVHLALGTLGKDARGDVVPSIIITAIQGQQGFHVARPKATEKYVQQEDVANLWRIKGALDFGVDTHKVTYANEQIEDLAEHIAHKVAEVGLLVVAGKVIDQHAQMGPALVLGHHRLVEVGAQMLQPATLPDLPEKSRQVEDKGLQQQDQHHPLIVADVATVSRRHRATHHI